jgi:hypothetical protein
MADTGEEIGRDFKTFIPALTDLADVQNAFKMYHFGVVNYTGIEEIPQESIEGHLGFMDERLASIEDRPTSGGIVSLTEPTSLSPENYHPAGYTPPAGMPTSYSIPNGFIWVDTSGDAGDMKFPQVYYSATEPTGLNANTDVGSIWVDSDNYKVHIWDGAAFFRLVSQNVVSEDIEITDATKGIILRSPNDTRYRITVDNAGVISTTVVP